MKNLENGTEFIWPKEKFLNRLYLMKEMYNNYEEEEEDWDLPEVNWFRTCRFVCNIYNCLLLSCILKNKFLIDVTSIKLKASVWGLFRTNDSDLIY